MGEQMTSMFRREVAKNESASWPFVGHLCSRAHQHFREARDREVAIVLSQKPVPFAGVGHLDRVRKASEVRQAD
jgi:hypothetical protein